jgi:hypothetical protein
MFENLLNYGKHQKMLFLKKLKQCLKKNNMLNVGQHLKMLLLSMSLKKLKGWTTYLKTCCYYKKNLICFF